MKMLPNEVSLSSPMVGVVLTNYRIRATGGGSLSSIMLNEITAIDVKRRDQKFYLYMAMGMGALFLYLLFEWMSQIPTIAIGAATAYFLYAYWTSKVSSIVIYSRGSASLPIETGKMANSVITEFIDLIEEAKFDYSTLAAHKLQHARAQMEV